MDKKALLEWYAEAGVDEAVDDKPSDHFVAPKISSPLEGEGRRRAATYLENAASSPTQPSPSRGEGLNRSANPKVEIPVIRSQSAAPAAASVIQATARVLADQCNTLDELRAAVLAFEGCALKKSASKTIFGDGNEKATVMLIGEAPGAQEDIQGIPFCGPSGQLLDKILASIGLTRAENIYISNTIFWRPPGNRQPSPEETAICLPFVEKHIALIAPRLLLLCGGTATTTLLQKDMSISRLRGKFYEYSNRYLTAPIPSLVIYHPSYLMRQPSQKKQAWHDMLLIKDFLAKN
jgi:uracil-DNA glycosylase family 4